jgi:hypothetical protein
MGSYLQSSLFFFFGSIPHVFSALPTVFRLLLDMLAVGAGVERLFLRIWPPVVIGIMDRQDPGDRLVEPKLLQELIPLRLQASKAGPAKVVVIRGFALCYLSPRSF